MPQTLSNMVKECVYNAISAVLGCILGLACGYNIHKQMYVNAETEVQHDTLTIVRVDTIREHSVKYIERHIIDSIPMENNQDVMIPIEQRHYAKANAYDAWVSGYRPSLDSIFVYPRTEERYVTNTVTKTMYKYSYGTYLYAGFKAFGSEVRPTIGIALKTPRKWLYGAEIGIYNKNDMYFGFNIGYNLLNK